MKNHSCKKLFLVGITIGVVAVLVIIFFHKENHATNEVRPISEIVSTPGGNIYARAATTDAQEELGLSYFKSLPQNQGMLFSFSSSGIHPFWMKDMKFSLDMIWMNHLQGNNFIVVSVTQHATPQSYPNTFQSTGPIDEVLEINANAAEKFGLQPSTIVSISTNSE